MIIVERRATIIIATCTLYNIVFFGRIRGRQTLRNALSKEINGQRYVDSNR